MYRAAAILYPDALPTSITLPMEIFHAASQMAKTRKMSNPEVSFQLASADGQPLRLASGLRFSPELSCDQLPELDLLLLPGIWRNPRPTLTAAIPWLDRLRQLASAGTRICSVGTASCLLAKAGLLDGKPATTHWNYFDAFAKHYPDVQLKTRHLITQCDNIYCAGSVNSIADLAVHFVEQRFGIAVARAVENQFSPEIRRRFSSAAYQSDPRGTHPDEIILDAQQWLQANLDQRVSITALARRLGLSARTLNRRFRRATGMTPQAYLQTLRIAAARDLLKHSNLAVSEIAWRVGFTDTSYFSALFRRHCGVPPLRYRAAVRGKLFAPPAATGESGPGPREAG